MLYKIFNFKMKAIAKWESFKIKKLDDLFSDDQWNLDEDFLFEGDKIQAMQDSNKVNRNMIKHVFRKEMDQNLNEPEKKSEDIINNNLSFSKNRNLNKSQCYIQCKQTLCIEKWLPDSQNFNDVSPKSWITFNKWWTLKDEISMLLSMLSKKNKAWSNSNNKINEEMIKKSDNKNEVISNINEDWFIKNSHIELRNQLQDKEKDFTIADIQSNIDIHSLFKKI